jgi:hypothetical protein
MIGTNDCKKLSDIGDSDVALPLLNYSPSSQNPRVEGYDVGGDEQARTFSTDDLLDSTDMDALIEAAYRQIFFHAFKWDREAFLESQLRNGQITVRDFVRGLLLSKTFYNSFYEKNNNYRFVEHCVERVLGPPGLQRARKNCVVYRCCHQRHSRASLMSCSIVKSTSATLGLTRCPISVAAYWRAAKKAK